MYHDLSSVGLNSLKPNFNKNSFKRMYAFHLIKSSMQTVTFEWDEAYKIYTFRLSSDITIWCLIISKKIPFIFKSSPLHPFQWVFLWSWLTYRMTSWASNCYGGLGMTPTPTSMTAITGSPGPATTSILLSPREWPLSSMESINCLLKTRISFRVQGKVVSLCKIPS